MLHDLCICTGYYQPVTSDLKVTPRQAIKGEKFHPPQHTPEQLFKGFLGNFTTVKANEDGIITVL